jgi:hypothetical protein
MQAWKPARAPNDDGTAEGRGQRLPRPEFVSRTMRGVRLEKNTGRLQKARVCGPPAARLLPTCTHESTARDREDWQAAAAGHTCCMHARTAL